MEEWCRKHNYGGMML